MKAIELSNKDLIKEIRRLEYNISRRLKRVSKINDITATYAINKFADLEEELSERLSSKMDRKHLTSLYRDLSYINTLKTSRVKEAKLTQQFYEPVKQKLESFDEETKSKFWEVWDKINEINPNFQTFKYTTSILETISDMVDKRKDYTIIRNITRLYDETLQKYEGNQYEEGFVIKFEEGLSKLSNKYSRIQRKY